MLSSWIVSIILIITIRWAVGSKPRLVPTRRQAIVEGILETIKNVIEPIVGKRMVFPVLPLLIGFFVYILTQNWSGLIPGVGAFGEMEANGHLRYFFRPGNADLNSTLALALVSFAAWLFYIFKYAGARSVFVHIFGNKADPKEVPAWLYIPMFGIFFGVGLIECVSILFRIVSLSFRLFGNVFGGENLITRMTGLCSYLVPVPFYFLEVLIGAIQAFVFTLLVAVYIGLICNHEEEHGTHEQV
jgi:F-type H+-transporting ATPase subunit a